MKLFRFQPVEVVNEPEMKKGLSMVIWDGLTAEMMISFTGGAFLIAMALLLGASNFQIGLLVALPMFTNVFQLISILLVRRFNNRRAIVVICSLLARTSLLFAGGWVLWGLQSSVEVLLFFLFFYYFFGSIAGPSWNSWMKDLVPEQMLGAYFSRRTRYNQTVNIFLSLILAFLLDYIKDHYPHWELNTYAVFFILAGAVGILGAFLLSRAPEPRAYLSSAKIFTLFKQPLADENFRRLLIFNAIWVFALNIAIPFFTVFMMKTLGLSLLYIIALSTISQLFSILTLRLWGVLSDRYSNKSIIASCAPVYILCILAWCFVGVFPGFYLNIALLVIIHMISGVCTAGINLSTANISLKLAPKDNAVVYLSVRNIVLAIFSALAPLLGGVLADFFAQRGLVISLQWQSPRFPGSFYLVSLKQWSFLFLIGAFLAFVSLSFLNNVKEVGEVKKGVIRRIMRTRMRSNLKDFFVLGNIVNLHQQIKMMVKHKEANENHPVS